MKCPPEAQKVTISRPPGLQGDRGTLGICSHGQADGYPVTWDRLDGEAERLRGTSNRLWPSRS